MTLKQKLDRVMEYLGRDTAATENANIKFVEKSKLNRDNMEFTYYRSSGIIQYYGYSESYHHGGHYNTNNALITDPEYQTKIMTVLYKDLAKKVYTKAKDDLLARLVEEELKRLDLRWAVEDSTPWELR